MKKILLSDIKTSLVMTASPETRIPDVLSKMSFHKNSCVVVVDTEHRPLGIFTERDTVRLLAEQRDPASLKIADVMSIPPFSSTDIDFREAYSRLQERGFRHLVVVDEEGRLNGIITEDDFLKHLDAGDLSEFKVAERIMSRNVVTVDIGETLAQAITLMSRHSYSCVVVMREQTPCGILTERDIVKLAASAGCINDMTANLALGTPLITAPPDMVLPDIIKLMDKHKIRHIVIADKNKLLGLLTRHDLAKTMQGSYVHFLQETIKTQRDELFKLSQQRSLFKLHAAALDAAANTILIADRQAVIQWVNPAFTGLTGYTAEEAVGCSIRDLLKSGNQSPEFYEELWTTILNGKVWHGEIVNRRKNGSRYDEEMTITPVRIESNEITHFIAIKQDISARKRIEAQFHDLAFHDALTHLPNRSLLNERLALAMAASKRSGRYGALLFLDLDNFKPLNDVYGHDTGDLLLVEVARRLCNCVREIDTVARFGGDEFVVMLSELHKDHSESTAQAGIVAEKIRLMLAEPYVLTMHPDGPDTTNKVEHHCSASIGAVLFINHEASPSDIIKWADLAMYEAKAEGGNLTRFYNK